MYILPFSRVAKKDNPLLFSLILLRFPTFFTRPTKPRILSTFKTNYKKKSLFISFYRFLSIFSFFHVAKKKTTFYFFLILLRFPTFFTRPTKPRLLSTFKTNYKKQSLFIVFYHLLCIFSFFHA